jgi:hypothetical protein
MAGIRESGAAVVLVAAWLGAQAAPAAQAHEHGVAQLDVAVQAQRLVIELDTPLDNLLGFERAPRSDAERDKAAAAVARLRDAAVLFRIDAAAGCTLARVELNSAVLGLGTAAGATPGAAEHGDLSATFEFRCTAGARAGFVEVGLFDAFPGLKRLDLQVATPRGQLKATLRRPASRVALAR